jgi:hypothetical protein
MEKGISFDGINCGDDECGGDGVWDCSVQIMICMARFKGGCK